MQSFIRICCKRIEIWDHKIVNYYKEVYAMGQVLPPTLHCHTFFLQIGNFGVLYFHASEADSCETMPSVFSSVYMYNCKLNQCISQPYIFDHKIEILTIKGVFT